MALASHRDPHIHAHVVASSPLDEYVEVFPNPRKNPLRAGLWQDRAEVSNGIMAMPKTPGLGLQLSEATVRRFLMESYWGRGPVSLRPMRIRKAPFPSLARTIIAALSGCGILSRKMGRQSWDPEETRDQCPDGPSSGA
jgi:hypothetical protein